MAELGLDPQRGRQPVTAEVVLKELRLFELRCEGEEVPNKREGSGRSGLGRGAERGGRGFGWAGEV